MRRAAAAAAALRGGRASVASWSVMGTSLTVNAVSESDRSTPESFTCPAAFLHSSANPDGYTLVTDLLIGVASDNCTKSNSETIEIDIMMIAESRNITRTELQDMLTQAQDL